MSGTQPVIPNSPAGGGPLTPGLVPDHVLLECVGRGSYGEVWLARNVMGRYRAVKVIHRNRFDEERPYEREFDGIQQFEPISRSHPGFISVLHVGRNDAAGYFYYVMEVADDVLSGQNIDPARYSAKTLAREVTRRGRLPVAECLKLGESLAGALSYLHGNGLIHRDIKPSNIVFVAGQPKFADVGLVAPFGETVSYVGTEGYLAPEGPAGPGADVYSLGKVFYQMSTGKAVREFPELPTDLAGGAERALFLRFNQIILRACETEALERFASAAAMGDALRACGVAAAGSESVDGPPGTRADADRPSLPPPRLDGERKHATVLSATIGFSGRVDPEEAHACLERCFEQMRAEIRRYDGTISLVQNEGIVALFGAPIAYEDHPQRAVHAALAIHRCLEQVSAEMKRSRGLEFHVRSGLDSGLLVIGGGKSRGGAAGATATGEAVNQSSRLMTLAGPGEILVSENLGTAVEGYFVTSPGGEHAVPGRTDPLRARRVTGARTERTRIEVEMQRGLSPFIGREPELALLGDRFADARRGQGQVVLLAGEPGVGKSRILLEFQRSLAGEDVTWLVGRAISYGRQTSYLPILDLLRQYFQLTEGESEATVRARIDERLRDLGEEIAPLAGFLKALISSEPAEDGLPKMDVQERKMQTFDALRLLLFAEARRRPLIVAVEDLHWVDTTSEEFLCMLAESLAGAPVLLLANYRPGYKSPFTDATYVTRVMLNRLSDDETARLAAGVLINTELPEDLRQLIAQKAEGNPFFVEELVRSLLESGALRLEGSRYVLARPTAAVWIPDTVQAVLMSRIDRLDPGPRKVLQLASVIGREFTLRLLQTIADRQEPLRASLQKLRSLELIYERSSARDAAYVFKHALTHDVAYHSLLIQRRQELHRLVAASIEELCADNLPESYSLLAYHYERGQEWERALDYLTRAAARSRAVGASREDAALLTQAIAVAEQLGRPELATELRGRRGIAWHRLGIWKKARPDLEQALAELPKDQLEFRAELSTYLAAACFWDLDIASVDSRAREAEILAAQVGRKDLLAEVMAWRSAAEQSHGNLILSGQLCRQALELGGGFHCAPLAMLPLNLYLRGKMDEAVVHGHELATMCRTRDDSLAASFGLPHLGMALAANGRFAEAVRAFGEASRIGIKHEIWPFHARCIAMSAGFHLDVFDFVGNEELAEEARERGRSAPFMPAVVSAGIDLILNFARRHDVARAEACIQETTDDAISVGGWHEWLWDLRLCLARAELALAREEWAEAARLAEIAASKGRQRARLKYEVSALETRARALAALGREREAIAALRQALELARPMGVPILLLRVASALVSLDGDDALLAEARAMAELLHGALPTEPMRKRFLDADCVRVLGRLPLLTR